MEKLAVIDEKRCLENPKTEIANGESSGKWSNWFSRTTLDPIQGKNSRDQWTFNTAEINFIDRSRAESNDESFHETTRLLYRRDEKFGSIRLT